MSHSNVMTAMNIFTRIKSFSAFVTFLIVVSASAGALAADHHRDPNNNFRSVPTTIKTVPNDTVLLPCYHSSPHIYIRWVREDVLLLDSREPNLQWPPGVTLFANGSLQVSNVQKNDTAEYVCEVMTSAGLATQIHAIEVQYAPSVLSVPSGTVEVQVGSIFEIVCETRGVPKPVITWEHQGRGRSDSLDNTRRYLVNVDSRNMAGPIECIAKNGVGEATAGIMLVVQFPPEIKATTNVVHSKIALRAYLQCEVVAQPAASVHWFHHGVPVVMDHHRITQQDSDMNFNETEGAVQLNSRSKHVLVIKRVQESDLGNYECRAENKLGYSGAEMELTGRPMPSVFRTSHKANTPMTHNLIWQTESLSPIIEHILKFRQVASGNVTPHNRHSTSSDWMQLVIPSDVGDGPIHTTGYNLRGLMPATVYEVSVMARNRYGFSEPSLIKRFATGGEIEVPNYSTETNYEPIDPIDETTVAEIISQSPASSHHEYSTQPSSAKRLTVATTGVILLGIWLSL